MADKKKQASWFGVPMKGQDYMSDRADAAVAENRRRQADQYRLEGRSPADAPMRDDQATYRQMAERLTSEQQAQAQKEAEQSALQDLELQKQGWRKY